MPVEATPPEELALMPRWRPSPPPGLSLSWADKSDSPPPDQVNWPMSIPLGVQLEFASLGSIQVTVSHFFSDGWGALWAPVPESCPDIPDPGTPTLGPAWTPGSSWPWRDLNKCKALYLLHKWLQHSCTPKRWPGMCCECALVHDQSK